MTKYAEVIFETGSHSVMSYESEDELKNALQVQHERAVNGMTGGPTGHPAERVKEVLLYDRHPADYNPNASSSVEVMEKEVSTALAKKAEAGVVGIEEAAAHVRRLADPLDHDAMESSRQNSMYRMKEKGKLSLAFLEGGK